MVNKIQILVIGIVLISVNSTLLNLDYNPVEIQDPIYFQIENFQSLNLKEF